MTIDYYLGNIERTLEIREDRYYIGYYFKNTNYRHREDGPASLNYWGRIEYFQNGRRHRIDGPAIISSKQYYIRYKLFSENDFYKKVAK